jgi:hypothetical protein
MIRFVDLTNENADAEICEQFLGFTSIDDSTGKELSDVTLKLLERNKFELKHCRGHGYNNAANMKGKNRGVKNRILDQNPLAFFMPCRCHNLNLVLCDAAKTSIKSVTLSGVLERLYSLFAALVYHLKILTDQVKSFTLKQLSDMHWEAKISSFLYMMNQLPLKILWKILKIPCCYIF